MNKLDRYLVIARCAEYKERVKRVFEADYGICLDGIFPDNRNSYHYDKERKGFAGVDFSIRPNEFAHLGPISIDYAEEIVYGKRPDQ